jgi:hypothetical protein
MWRRVLCATVAVAIAACTAPATTGASPSAKPTVVRITAEDAARAMAADRFFSDYEQAILVISGRVGDVTPSGNNARIALTTSSAAVVICETFGAPSVTIGDTIQVRVRGSDALRDDAGVLLRNCELVLP